MLRNPDAFPDEIMDIQKQLGLDVGLGFRRRWPSRHPGGVMALTTIKFLRGNIVSLPDDFDFGPGVSKTQNKKSVENRF